VCCIYKSIACKCVSIYYGTDWLGGVQWEKKRTRTSLRKTRTIRWLMTWRWSTRPSTSSELRNSCKFIFLVHFFSRSSLRQLNISATLLYTVPLFTTQSHSLPRSTTIPSLVRLSTPQTCKSMYYKVPRFTTQLHFTTQSHSLPRSTTLCYAVPLSTRKTWKLISRPSLRVLIISNSRPWQIFFFCKVIPLAYFCLSNVII